VSCPHCDQDARFVGYRATQVRCLMGPITYERAYYHCRHCHEGWFPTDEEFGIEQKQTPGCREVVTLVGTLEPFEPAANGVLLRLTGTNLSGSTVRRTTEQAGDDLARRRAAGEVFGPERAWDWHADACGQSVAYVSVDATAVRQQGSRAEKAESRMPWVASVFNPLPKGQPGPRRVWDARYVSGLMSLPEIAAQLRRECRAVGVAQAERVVGLTDGGAGLEECLLEALRGEAREIVFILDFWHAAEHLREFAHALIPHDAERRKAQVEAWCHRLKHQGGTALLEELQELDLSGAAAPLVEAHRQLTLHSQTDTLETEI
jgi:hypothetical protein